MALSVYKRMRYYGILILPTILILEAILTDVKVSINNQEFIFSTDNGLFSKRVKILELGRYKKYSSIKWKGVRFWAVVMDQSVFILRGIRLCF
jgi:hypothetical protein